MPIEPTITYESQYDLPPGWVWIPLGHLGNWAAGCGFPKTFQGETGGEFLFCKVSDMNLPGNEVEIHTTVNTIDAAVMQKIRARPNPIGTVIFPKIGGAIATHKRRLVIKPTIIDNNCSGIRPIGLTDSRWLLLLLRSIDLTLYQSGTSVPAVSQSSIDPIRIGLPPLAEQRRIVEKVDQLLGLCDELAARQAAQREKRQRLVGATLDRLVSTRNPAEFPTHAHRLRNQFDQLFDTPTTIPQLRQTILQLAVQGQLVPQDPNDEPAIRFLLSIDDDRRGDLSVKLLAGEASDASHNNRFSIPASWDWAWIGQLGETQTGTTPKSGDHEAFGSDYPFIKPADILRDRVVYDNVGLSRTGVEKYGRVATAGSVLMVCIGTIGKCNLITCDCSFNQQINSITPLPQVDSSLLLYFLQSPYFQTEAWQRSTSTTISLLNKGNWESIPIPIPPLAEQKRIVTKVTELLSLCDALEAKLTQAESAGTQLLSAAVHHLLNESSREGAKARREKP